MNNSRFVFPKGTYIVAGAAGFIGSHLSERLLAEGCDVVGVDNFISGHRRNLEIHLSEPRFRFIEHDIIQPLEVNGKLSGVFHLASPASPLDYLRFSLETLRVGAFGTDHMLKLAMKHGCPILVASTSEVYGDPLEHPQKESYWGNVNPIGPRGCYDESKRFLEALTMAHRRKLGLNTRIIRIFNTYGPRMKLNDGRVVPNFIMQALQNSDITVYGDGSQTRSFCYVDDLVEGILRVFMSGHSEPVNLGNPTEMTVLNFAEKIIGLLSSKSQIIFCALPQDDPKIRRPDISLARSLLGWEPQISLDEGLKKTISYFKGLTR